MKCVLSQTAFCGAVHLHGSEDESPARRSRQQRLAANRSQQSAPRDSPRLGSASVRRSAFGGRDQARHREFRDGPFAFTSPAIVNTIYGRWWWPADEKPGANPVPDSPLPWTGDYLDGLGNKITMLAYANPPDRKDEKQRADGFGIVRFNKTNRQVTFECWPRFADVDDGDTAQFPGWPITFNYRDNDGRKPVGYLPELVVTGSRASRGASNRRSNR